MVRLRTRSERGFPTAAEACDWVAAELPNLVATVVHCAGTGPGEVAWTLSDSMRGYFALGRDMAQWNRVATAGLAAAVAAGDPRAEAALALNVGQSLTYRHHGERALPHLERALHLCEEADWAEGQSACLNALAHLNCIIGRPRQASVHLRRGMAVNRQLNRRPAEAKQLSNLGIVYTELGRPAAARECFLRALEIHRDGGHPTDEVGPLNGLIDVSSRLGLLSDAIAYATQSISICREYGRSEACSTARTVAQALVELATLDLRYGAVDRAHERYAEAVALLQPGGSAGRTRSRRPTRP